MTGFLDHATRRSLQAAVQRIEAESAAEVVVVVRTQSGRYLHADLAGGIAAGWLSLGFLLWSPWGFSLWSIFVDPLLCGLAGGWLVSRLPSLRRWLTPPSFRREAVASAARALFVERGIAETRQRSGILVYLSQLERDASVIADRGMLAAVPSERWESLRQELVRALRTQDGASAARALEQFAAVAHAAMPRLADDQNELGDAVSGS